MMIKRDYHLMIVCFFMMITLLCFCQAMPVDSNTPDIISNPKGPIIIWYYNVHRFEPKVIKPVLESGLVNHVMVKCLHRKDFNFRTDKRTQEALKIVKGSSAKLIWSRALWETYDVPNDQHEFIWDANYYAEEIRMIRKEAEEIGADYTSLDLEPYGKSKIKKLILRKGGWSIKDLDRLDSVIMKAIDLEGKVDFVYPAGSMIKTCPYEIMAKIGTLRIAENTYFDYPKKIKKIPYEYEIFGAFISNTKQDLKNKTWIYFLPEEIFERSELWSHKQGLFLFPTADNTFTIAQRIKEYSNTLNETDTKREKKTKSEQSR